MAKITPLRIIADTCERPWAVAVAPFAITDRIYYVGNAWVGAYLIDTGDGLALLDTTTAETGYLLLHSIVSLGFRPADIRWILLSHAHVDHYGSARMLQALSHAALYLSEEDERFRHNPAAAAVGRIPGIDFREYDFTPDAFYRDDRPLALGCVTVRTRLTPGHTPGTTTFFLEAPDRDGRVLTAAMHGGVGVLTMGDAALRQAGLSPALRRQFIRDCEALRRVPVDICLPSHPAHGALFAQRDRGRAGGNPFVDPTAWAAFLESRIRFAEELEEDG